MVLQQNKSMAANRPHGRLSADERAARIYQVAAKLICEQGYDATSMNEIAESVNLTKAGLYYYVPGKKQLLYAIVSYAMAAIETEVIEPCRLMNDPTERLREIVRRHTLLLTQVGSGITILTAEVRGLSPAHRRTMKAKKRAYLEFVRETLEALKRQRKLRSKNVGLVSMNLFSTILGVARWYRPEGKESGEIVAEEVADFVMAGVLKSS